MCYIPCIFHHDPGLGEVGQQCGFRLDASELHITDLVRLEAIPLAIVELVMHHIPIYNIKTFRTIAWLFSDIISKLELFVHQAMIDYFNENNYRFSPAETVATSVTFHTPSIQTETHTDIQTNKQTSRQTYTTRTDRQKDRQTNRQTYKKKDRHTYTHI